MNTYNRLDIDLVSGQGVWAEDINGKKYLDFCAGIAVNSLGHAHPEMVKTLTSQGNKIWHTANLFTSHLAEQLAKSLCEKSFANKVFFCNSGAEAMDGAIKTIRKYFYDQSKPEKNRIITFQNAFHGRSISTVSASHRNTEGFAPLLDGFDKAIFNDIDSVKKLITPNTAAIFLEPIQGEAGIVIPHKQFIKDLKQLTIDNDLVLGFDEIQTGVARTGCVWCYECFDVEPDILTTAKGLGGGFPIGAILTTDKLAKSMGPGTHGSTFGGNPLAVAVAKTVFDITTSKQFLKNVGEMGQYLKLKLGELENVKQVRSLGLMAAIEFEKNIDSSKVFKACADNGLLTVRAACNCIRLLPPLIVEKEHIHMAIEKLKTAIKSV